MKLTSCITPRLNQSVTVCNLRCTIRSFLALYSARTTGAGRTQHWYAACGNVSRVRWKLVTLRRAHGYYLRSPPWKWRNFTILRLYCFSHDNFITQFARIMRLTGVSSGWSPPHVMKFTTSCIVNSEGFTTLCLFCADSTDVRSVIYQLREWCKVECRFPDSMSLLGNPCLPFCWKDMM